MRRVPLFLLFVVPFTTIASAQTGPVKSPAFNVFFGAAEATAATDPEIVVARLMTFDRDHDGLVVKNELPERMQNLIAADASGDGALDRAEIRKLAMVPMNRVAAAATVTGFSGGRGGGGGYTFGDQLSLSTRAHVEGALDDLRLPAGTHQQALAIVRPFMTRLEADATAVLFKDVEGVLAPSQFSAFKTIIERQLSAGQNQPTLVARPDGTKVTSFFVIRGPDPALIINASGLTGDHKAQALAAFEGFKARIRPADADREALLDELDGVLTAEQRDDFAAALQRRPLVKAGGPGIVAGNLQLQNPVFERNVVPRGGAAPIIDVSPAVLKLTLPPQRQQ
jgi:hypothetical protein